ncbi:MAG: hypothetical protein M1829_000819 [Trizodia sp. TS-e1964]|nr:MAG: hypothetical protein M1829_000819 [Trizodia sp. TS-e1964]
MANYPNSPNYPNYPNYPSLSRYIGILEHGQAEEEEEEEDDDEEAPKDEDSPDQAEHASTSDYGSDFTPDEENILSQLVSSFQSQQSPRTEQQQQQSTSLHDIEDLPPPGLSTSLDAAITDSSPSLDDNESTTSILPRSSRSHSPTAEPGLDGTTTTAEPLLPPDTRPPLSRFRTAPQKPLSVTDLISPAWCELQYWYSLTRHGRKRRTPAMKRGSTVHKALEEQVHTTIAVATTTREDAWALRLWNVIQGLRTLRETGLTRELEVWGLIEGEVVVGIIDQLSFTCPDDELAAKEDAEAAGEQAQDAGGGGGGGGEGGQKLYLTDIKTRAAANVPHGASFRPTLLQLMLYHRLLTSLPTLDFPALFARYRLSPDSPFSDVLIAQVAALPGYGEICPSPPASPSSTEDFITVPTSPDALSLLLRHNTLAGLFPLLQRELRLTLPPGGISRVLAAEYHSAVAGGGVTGVKTFLYDARVLGRWLADAMRWWRGEREARGVEVAEAWKCRGCEFAEGCEWREGKVEEGLRRGRERMRAREGVVEE